MYDLWNKRTSLVMWTLTGIVLLIVFVMILVMELG